MKYIEDIKLKLKLLKCEIEESKDITMIKYMANDVLESINNITNQNYTLEKLPYGLKYLFIDKVIGSFLVYKKNAGELTTYDFSLIEKSIQEGDTRVEWNIVGTAEETFDSIVNYLRFGKDRELYRYRRIQWE